MRASLLIFILAVSLNSNAQDLGGGSAPPPRFARNTIYAEALGNGLGISLNYERLIYEKINLRIGLGLYIADSGDVSNLGNVYVPYVPVMGNYLLRLNEGSNLEFGAGVVLQLSTVAYQNYLPPASNTVIKPTLLVGYRYQLRPGGFVLRAGFTPVWYGGGVYWGAGMSLGGAF